MWAVACAVLLCAAFAGVLLLGQVAAARQRAGQAADLSALAAADQALDGPRRACRLAGRVAGEQGARLVRCQLVGEIVDLTVEARGGPFTARARARAGPATAAPPTGGPAGTGPPPWPEAAARAGGHPPAAEAADPAGPARAFGPSGPAGAEGAG